MRAIFFKLFFWSGVGPLLIWINKRRKQVPIFLFHRVSSNWDMFTEPLSPSQFKNIIIFLRRFYKLESLKKLLKSKPNELKNTAYVVFDDAMLDFYESSLPILKEQNVPVTVFVATEPVTKGNTIWNYQLFDFFLNTLFTEFELEIDNNIYRFKKDRNYYQDVMVFHQKMLHKSPDEISKLFDFISKQLEVEEINNFAPVCSWSHLTQISNLEIDLQAHTHSHSYLPKQSAEVMNKEFSLSKKEIKTKIGIETAMIAYPNGGYNNQVIELARKYFSYGFSVDEKFVNLNRLNDPIYRMIIPRFNVHDQCAEEILLRTFGFHKMLRNIKSSIGL